MKYQFYEKVTKEDIVIHMLKTNLAIYKWYEGNKQQNSIVSNMTKQMEKNVCFSTNRNS